MDTFKPGGTLPKSFNEARPHTQLRHALVGGDFYSSSNLIRTDRDFIVKDVFSVSNDNARFLRGQVVSRTAVSGNYSTAVRDFIVGVTSLISAPTIGLPRPKNVGAGKTYIIKDEVGGAGTTTITVRSEGEETIDGATTSTLTTNYQSRRYYTNGATWFTY